MHDYQRPPTLHRYGPRSELDLALAQGQFVLRPENGFLTLSFSQAWSHDLFEHFGADSCLVIHNTEEFGERIHRAVQRTLPNWAGIDGAVEYGTRAALGAAFTMGAHDAAEREWKFAWRPMHSQASMNPVVIRVGSLEQFAEVRGADWYPS
ncbi:hypothetical protein [Pseudoduganella chitinolytica]|uniref:Uncharacterized protein n=1 Tax=Pseudoduganella chitinolytica TaxID=34070 RepID=A0ABY8B8T6_9BURK|nr:hypothetical protein [Pseudoduganella chitinolytica]WEF31838.1 hypothetical protein PX653_20735 [Pseudoduganella chitinolytica]